MYNPKDKPRPGINLAALQATQEDEDYTPVAPETEPAPAIIPDPLPEPFAPMEGRRGPGRPPGKHSDKENYRQITGYIRRDTHQQIKVRLAEEQREYSEVLQELLDEYLRRPKAPKEQ